MFLISQSQLKKLEAFNRLNDVKMEKRDLYDFMPFSLKVTGTVDTLKTFLNSLHEARFYFMVRDIDFSVSRVQELPQPGGPRSGKPEPLPKNKRLAYSNEPPTVRADIILDYFEFHDKE